jgi:glycosyltransferase involved in cell wall biosynthesis
MEKNNYDFCVVITTYNREQELKKLLNDIFLNNPYNILVLVFDGIIYIV